MDRGEFNPEMLILARQIRNQSQIDISKAIGLAQGSISKIEKGLLIPSEENLHALASSLCFPKDFFFQKIDEIPPVTALHRKQASLSVKSRAIVESKANLIRYHIQKIYKKLPWEVKFKKMIGFNPSLAASELRFELAIPTGPLLNITEIVESLGIVIVPINLQNLPIDGFAMVSEADNEIPIIFINDSRSGDRERLNIAHELGHILLHEMTADNVEREAWEFASELLMPKADIVRDLADAKLSIKKFENLKKKWQVSMVALIKRSNTLKIISDQQYRYLMVQMASFRKIEPVVIKKETPTLLKTKLTIYKDELKDNITLSEDFHIYENDLQEFYGKILNT